MHHIRGETLYFDENDLGSAEIPRSAYMSPIASGWRNQSPSAPNSPRSPNPNMKLYSTPRMSNNEKNVETGSKYFSTFLKLLPFIGLQLLFLALFIPSLLIISIVVFAIWIFALTIDFCVKRPRKSGNINSQRFRLPNDF